MPTRTAAPPRARTVRLGRTSYPVVLPSVRDPRLHLAAVIISIHALGQGPLEFDVSIAQILVGIGTAAVLEVVWTFVRDRRIVWPASAMLTGSGVALVLRVVGTAHGDWWSLRGWHVFAVVAAASVASKYVIRYRAATEDGPESRPLFNPSNLGLVVAFVVLGSGRVEPLDFWWGPMGRSMAVVYVVIVAGGILITRRLGLLPMAAAFWLTFAALTGVTAWAGHCFTARWSLDPVCDGQFWWVVVTSPEVLIFLFFMITDPKTSAAGRVARVWFGMLVGVASALLLVPWSTEFGAKVGLLGGLVLVCALRPLLDRRCPAPGSAGDGLGLWLGLEAAHPTAFVDLGVGAAGDADPRAVVPRIALVVGLLSVAVVGSVGLSTGSRDDPFQVDLEDLSLHDPVDLPDIDPATVPPVVIAHEVTDFDPLMDQARADAIAVFLARCLAGEAVALRARDTALLFGVDHGTRQADLTARIDEAGETIIVPEHHFDEASMVVTHPGGPQSGARLGIRVSGTVDQVEVAADGTEVGRRTEDLAATFSMVAVWDRWVVVDVAGVVDD